MPKAVNRCRLWMDDLRPHRRLIDEVFRPAVRTPPGPMVERLQVHPADGDNVYFIGDQQQFDLKQLDTWPTGQPHSSSRTEDGIMRPTLPRQSGSAVPARSQVHVNGCRPPSARQEPVR